MRALRMNRRLLLLALPALASLPLGACSVIPDRPYVETRRFPLDPRRDGPPARRGRGRVLQVRLMRAAPGQDTRGLRTLREDGTISVDFYAEWSAPPVELAEEAMRRWLSASGLFSGVVATGSRVSPDLVLESELTALHADLAKGEAVAGLSVVLLRETGGDAQLLTQLAIRGTAPLPPQRPLPPELAAESMNEALASALGVLERGLARYA